MKNSVSQDKNIKRIAVSEMAPHVHGFSANENKVEKISNWLINWIKTNLEKGNIKEYDYLPSKADLAFHIGVSLGTMQNVFRKIEDIGLIESKQKVGSYVKKTCSGENLYKLTSKREIIAEKIKQFIVKNNYNVGDKIPSIRNLAEEFEISPATVRNAVNYLMVENFLAKTGNHFTIQKKDEQFLILENRTLVDKVAEKISSIIIKEYESGDKIPSNSEFARKFKVSVKTIYDAIKILSKRGILSTRRGKYGTIIADSDNITEKLYDYEKIEQKIKQYIQKNCEIGSKLDSMKKLASKYSVSTKTIKKALDILKDDGYIMYSRGRYGGTFVTDIPQKMNEAYTWLALNNDYKMTDIN